MTVIQGEYGPYPLKHEPLLLLQHAAYFTNYKHSRVHDQLKQLWALIHCFADLLKYL